MTAQKDPLLADVDPNRAFIKDAVKFLQSRSDYGDDAADQILREYFIQSGMQDAEWLSDKLERQLTFRDGLNGDKMNALTALREVYAFMRCEVYDTFTDQDHPKSQELCDTLMKARDALDVLSAGFVDSDSLRSIQNALDMEDPNATCETIPIRSEPLYKVEGNIINLRTLAK